MQFTDNTIQQYRQYNTSVPTIKYDYTHKSKTVQTYRRSNLQTILYSNTDNTIVLTIQCSYTDNTALQTMQYNIQTMNTIYRQCNTALQTMQYNMQTMQYNIQTIQYSFTDNAIQHTDNAIQYTDNTALQTMQYNVQTIQLYRQNKTIYRQYTTAIQTIPQDFTAKRETHQRMQKLPLATLRRQQNMKQRRFQTI